jgi:hypothetical protein
MPVNHDLLVHLQRDHGAMPPYEASPKDVHIWLHEDANDPRDTNHQHKEGTP